MWKYLVGFVVVMHGLAHVSGPLGFWTTGEQAFGDGAWLFSGGVTARSALGQAFGVVWILAAVGLVAGGVGLALGHPWWPSAAVAGAALSLVAIVPWARVVPPGAWAGAVFDLALLVTLLPPWADRVVAFLR
jgi:hypothetical protein